MIPPVFTYGLALQNMTDLAETLSISPTSGNLTVKCNAEPGIYNLTVIGTLQNLQRAWVNFKLNITALPPFSIPCYA